MQYTFITFKRISGKKTEKFSWLKYKRFFEALHQVFEISVSSYFPIMEWSLSKKHLDEDLKILHSLRFQKGWEIEIIDIGCEKTW